MIFISKVALCCINLGFYQASGSPIVTGQLDDASEEQGEFLSTVLATDAVFVIQGTSGEFNTVIANGLKRDRTE